MNSGTCPARRGPPWPRSSCPRRPRSRRWPPSRSRSPRLTARSTPSPIASCSGPRRGWASSNPAAKCGPAVADAPLLPTGDDEQFLSEITQDFKRLQAQKAKRQGGAEARMLVARAFEAGEQGSYYKARGLYARNTETDEEKNKLHLVFNLVKQRKHKLVGRLGAIGATFKANPDKTDVAATDLASIVDRLILALDKKVDQPALQRALLDLLTLEGVCVEYVGWNERATIEPMPQFTPDNQLLFVDRVASDASGQLVIVPEAEKQAAVAAGKPDEAYELYEVA